MTRSALSIESDSPTLDRLLDGRVKFWQPRRGYRVALDAVFLAAATPARPGERVLDAGTGVAAAALCLAARVPGLHVTGFDIQPTLLTLAARNIALHLENAPPDDVQPGDAQPGDAQPGDAQPGDAAKTAFALVEGDVRHPAEAFVALHKFDHVMVNPPFMKSGAHTPSKQDVNALARGETETADLNAWVTFCAAMLRPRGTLTMIHRADRIDEILALLQPKFGGVVVSPLWPRFGQPARRVLLTAQRGARSPARLEFGLVLHRADGAYTTPAESVLRHARSLREALELQSREALELQSREALELQSREALELQSREALEA